MPAHWYDLSVLLAASLAVWPAQVPGVEAQEPALPAGAVWQFNPTADGQARRVDHVRFAPGGSLLAVWGDSPRIWLVDTKTGKIHSEFSAPIPITDVCFGQDRNTVYAINHGERNGLICWNVATGEQTAVPGYSGLLIEAVGPNLLMAVDQRGWQILGVPELTPQGLDYFDEPLLPLCIDATTGAIIAVETMAGQVGQRSNLIRFDTKTRLSRRAAVLAGLPTKACVIPDQDGTVAYCEQGVGGIKVVSLSFTDPLGTHQPATTSPTTKLGQSAVLGLAATSDGRFLTAVEAAGAIRIWELASRDAVAEIAVGAGRVTSISVAGSPAAIAVSVTDEAGSRVLLFRMLDTLRSLAADDTPQRTMDQWLEQLSHPSAAEAFAAAAWLAHEPSQSIPALHRHVESIVVIPNERDVARWISELDSPEFSRRRTARDALLSVHDLVLPQLQAALNAGHTLGTEISLKQLIYASPAESDRNPKTVLGGLRLISTLQMIDNHEAAGLITKLKAGHPSARVRRAAAHAEATAP